MDDAPRRTVWNCRIDKSGRICLPSGLRDAAGLGVGEDVVFCFEDGILSLRTFDDALKRLQEEFNEGLDQNVSLVDELIADRRKDAELEMRD